MDAAIAAISTFVFTPRWDVRAGKLLFFEKVCGVEVVFSYDEHSFAILEDEMLLLAKVSAHAQENQIFVAADRPDFTRPWSFQQICPCRVHVS